MIVDFEIWHKSTWQPQAQLVAKQSQMIINGIIAIHNALNTFPSNEAATSSSGQSFELSAAHLDTNGLTNTESSSTGMQKWSAALEWTDKLQSSLQTLHDTVKTLENNVIALRTDVSAMLGVDLNATTATDKHSFHSKSSTDMVDAGAVHAITLACELFTMYFSEISIKRRICDSLEDALEAITTQPFPIVPTFARYDTFFTETSANQSFSSHYGRDELLNPFLYAPKALYPDNSVCVFRADVLHAYMSALIYEPFIHEARLDTIYRQLAPMFS